MTKIRLFSNQGSDECNYGSQRYRVSNAGIVEVDAEAVGPLLAVGGFSLAEEVPPVAVDHGTIRVMHVSDPTATCSFAGVSYIPTEDGSVTVPMEAVPHLAWHGFVPVPRSGRLTPSQSEGAGVA
jgi:hypothetical protein